MSNGFCRLSRLMSRELSRICISAVFVWSSGLLECYRENWVIKSCTDIIFKFRRTMSFFHTGMMISIFDIKIPWTQIGLTIDTYKIRLLVRSKSECRPTNQYGLHMLSFDLLLFRAHVMFPVRSWAKVHSQICFRIIFLDHLFI